MQKFKQFLKTAWKKVKCATKEIFNFLTNLLCPVLAAVCVVAEVFNLPTTWIKALKQAEYWCWHAAGTKEVIETFVEKVEEAIDKTVED